MRVCLGRQLVCFHPIPVCRASYGVEQVSW